MPSKSDVKKSTLEVYEKNLNKLSQDVLGKDSAPDDCKWLEDFDKVMASINTSKSLHTRKNKINTVVIYMQLDKCDEKVLKKYQNEIIKLSKNINDNYNNNTKNEKQELNWMSYDELKNVIEKIKSQIPVTIEKYSDYKKLLSYLTLSTHLEIPLRNDLVDAQIYKLVDFNKIDEEDDVNYIVIGKNSGFIVLNNYKTSGSYGRKKIILPDPLFKIWRKYLPIILNFTKSNKIFIKENLEKMNRNEFTKLFHYIFKDYNKKISSSMIRHIVISHKFPVDPNEMKEREELADIMGHSTKEAMQVYAKAS
jgi:hypothetical protein